MKVGLYLAVYIVVLFPCLVMAIDKAMAIIDPGTLIVVRTFWMTGTGQGLIIGFAFVAAAMATSAFAFVLKRLPKGAGSETRRGI